MPSSQQQVDYLTNAAGTGRTNVLGDPTGLVAVPAGYIGETFSQIRLSSAEIGLTSSVTADITASPLVLTAGIWLMSGAVRIEVSSSQVTSINAGISKTSATLPTNYGGPVGDEAAFQWIMGNVGGPAFFGASSNIITPYVVNLAVTTTFYLVAQASWVSGSGTTACGYFQAVRIA